MARVLGRVFVSATPAAVSAAVGVWLSPAPSVLGYDGIAASIHLIAGPIALSFGVIALALVPIRGGDSFAGGWIGLMRDGR